MTAPALSDAPTFLILGCGFTGTEVARRAIDAGHRVIATTRSAERREELEKLGVDLRVEPALTGDLVRSWMGPNVNVLVAFAPDGHTDAEIAPELSAAGALVYVSTTGVYGATRGHVDESTPVDGAEPRAAQRLEAERCYRDAGAAVVRAAGIYGPGRGLHLRLKSGTFRVPGEGTGVVSRIHVADLAQMILGVFRRAREGERGAIFVAADDTPVPQMEAIAWLCRRLGLPLPAHVPLDLAPSTLRHDRAVDNHRIKSWTGLSLLFPSYREGFEACLADEVVNPLDSAAPRAEKPPGSLPPSE
ncbi:MAG TPA: NAD-dependent epimerase/dehydratase family protein [Polyangiaceae bacterium]|nr:NAD-dependent epimerase/dehydratase family protein [Polyangiaceae bacterium]